MADSAVPTHRSPSGFDLTPPSAEERRTLEASLTHEEAHVLLSHGTEAPFCGVLLGEKRQGAFDCRLCGLPLFRSDEKFESGTGWPSFTTPYDQAHLKLIEDNTYGMKRVETVCARWRQPPGACLPRRAAAHRPALLHQLGGAQLHAQGEPFPDPFIAARRTSRRRRGREDGLDGAGLHAPLTTRLSGFAKRGGAGWRHERHRPTLHRIANRERPGGDLDAAPDRGRAGRGRSS